ncbi:transcription factor bHLH106-like [Phragmites australis]|uniref:transcription factor bHLH106-like n=1 Tax=Phragmites australis TaxID=29695 RepID=UPI002D7A0900|nr:transcription factor bHLH106-like [Phragmites australis]
MFPAEVSALGGAGAARQGEGGAVLPMLPPFFMGSIWPAGAGAAGTCPEEDETAAAAAAAAAHDRALAASRNHREAEKRRRERIKSHLDRLRNVLACDPKIDKASLLAKAVERVRDLKQRVASVGEAAPAHLFPTEHDEIVVLASGGAVFEASVCCDDRSDLLPELIETLRALRLRTLRAEMATLGGRVRNVLILARDAAGDDVGGGVTGDDGYGRADSAGSSDGNGGDSLKEALRALVERPGAAGGDRPKRRRVSGMNMQATA